MKEEIQNKKQRLLYIFLLYIFTFGLYFLFWFYNSWKKIKDYTETSFNLSWKIVGLFIPIYNMWVVYTLFREVDLLRKKINLSRPYPPEILAFLFILLTFSIQVLPYPWWILAFILSVFPILECQAELNEYWDNKNEFVEEDIRAKSDKTIKNHSNYCPNCGANIKKGASFCTQCGKKI
ncbi:zinc-ribbon domain-containing protein [Candidatus Parcubacteria bacterium]|nr:zinc-ribbon domain-containing protein [Candidatus Parcubacteria bacterium]